LTKLLHVIRSYVGQLHSKKIKVESCAWIQFSNTMLLVSHAYAEELGK